MKKLFSILILVSILITCLSSCELLKYIGVQSELPSENDDIVNELPNDNNVDELPDNNDDVDDGVGKFYYLPTYVKLQVDGEKQAVLTATISLNKQNLPSQIVSLNAEYGGKCTIDFTYDEKGNCVNEVWTKYDDGRMETVEYTYDEKSNLIKVVCTASDGFGCIYDYTYDDNGNLMKEVMKKNDGFSNTYDYAYDDNGNLIKKITTDSSGYVYIRDYTYDENGNLIKELQRRSDRDTASTYLTFSYDENNNLIEKVHYYNDGGGDHFYLSSIVNYTYDKKSNLIKEVITVGSERDFHSTIDYTYDENGNLIKKVETYYDGEKYTCEFTYTLLYIPFEFSSEKYLEYIRFLNSTNIAS